MGRIVLLALVVVIVFIVLLLLLLLLMSVVTDSHFGSLKEKHEKPVLSQPSHGHKTIEKLCRSKVGGGRVGQAG